MSQSPEFNFDKVLFFGRSVDEYRTMFNFEPEKWRGKRILDCCSGPAALAANGGQWGLQVVACDPMYEDTAAELKKHVEDDVAAVDHLQAKTMDLFDDAVRRAQRRRQDMQTFLDDFASGERRGTYVAGALPHLPFETDEFDLTLCGNFLFLYSDLESGGMMRGSPFDYAFHLASLKDLARVTRGEVRLYPLNGPAVERHAYLDRIFDELKNCNITCELVPVPHKDIKTAVHLLSMRKKLAGATA